MNTLTSCPNCSRTLPLDADICPHCSQALGLTLGLTLGLAVEQEYCPECSAPLADDEMQCAACGAEFALSCAACGAEVEPTASICPQCGDTLDDENMDETTAVAQPTSYSGICPQCQIDLHIEDGFCMQCGATFCSSCGQLVDEDDDICPHCQTALYFACPGCGFELTAGTDQCPNCSTLIPSFCTNCHAAIAMGLDVCPGCREPIVTHERSSARIVNTLIVSDKLVQMAACPKCGANYDASNGRCQKCDYRACAQCQINLFDDETICPRCGPVGVQVVQRQQATGYCPKCSQRIRADSDECERCGQQLCPQCQSAIGEDDAMCQRCGTEFEFEFICPNCEASLDANANRCLNCGVAV